MMIKTRLLVEEADILIKDVRAGYIEKYTPGTVIDDFYLTPTKAAATQIERLVGTLLQISTQLDPSPTKSMTTRKKAPPSVPKKGASGRSGNKG
jgi:hypothetical protein